MSSFKHTSAGAVTLETLLAAPNKAYYYAGEYRSMHSGIYSHPNFIDVDGNAITNGDSA